MEENNIEWRLYGLVPYNISEIQKGIQFGHAAIEYGQKYFNDDDYQEWANNHKTFIILNGGTSSTMIDNIDILRENGVDKLGIFQEPDLNHMISGIVFLVDSRVYDYTNYPNFYDYCLKIKGRYDLPKFNEINMDQFIEAAKEMGSSDYRDWVKFMGGEKNIFLREYLSKLKLA